jgi:hypothetical protein
VVGSGTGSHRHIAAWVSIIEITSTRPPMPGAMRDGLNRLRILGRGIRRPRARANT